MKPRRNEAWDASLATRIMGWKMSESCTDWLDTDGNCVASSMSFAPSISIDSALMVLSGLVDRGGKYVIRPFLGQIVVEVELSGMTSMSHGQWIAAVITESVIQLLEQEDDLPC